MVRFYVEDRLSVLPRSYCPISAERVIAEITEGTVCARVLSDEGPVGLALFGTCRFAVDAILETTDGAVGGPVTGELNGTFVIFGDLSNLPELEGADDQSFQRWNVSPDRFVKQVTDILDEMAAKVPRSVDTKRGTMLAGEDSGGIHTILVESEDRVVLVRGDHVVAITDDALVVVDDDRVSVTTSQGRCVEIGRDTRLGPTDSGHPFSVLYSVGTLPFRASCRSWNKWYDWWR